jgi:putative spermidine/putrescine transport system permease protein
MTRFFAWGAFLFGLLFFLLPLLGMTEFSLSMRRGVYSLDAYRSVLGTRSSQATFMLFGGHGAGDHRLRRAARRAHRLLGAAEACRELRPWIEFITLLPLVIPAIVIVFGYIRLYNTSSFLPLTGTAMGTNLLLMFGYATLALPYMYRAVDTGLRTIDVVTLTEAAQSLGAGWGTILAKVILPNVLVAVLSGAFLTFAIVMGEFTMAALLNRPAFGPYMQLLGANKAYEPSALAVIAFAITWGCMGLIQLVTRFQKHNRVAR